MPAATFKIPHMDAMTNIGPQWETIGRGATQTRPGPGNAYMATFPGPESRVNEREWHGLTESTHPLCQRRMWCLRLSGCLFA